MRLIKFFGTDLRSQYERLLTTKQNQEASKETRMALDRYFLYRINRVLVCVSGSVGVKVSMNTFAVIVKLASIGDTFFRKEAAALGADQYMINRLQRNEFIEKAEGVCEWRITDKAYRAMTQMHKLLEQVK